MHEFVYIVSKIVRVRVNDKSYVSGLSKFDIDHFPC